MVLSDYPLARKNTGLINVFPLGRFSLLTGEIILCCSLLSENLFTLSCKCIGFLLARCFLKTASCLSGVVVV